jgi:DNA-binding NarL/FixJ family response regulator
MDRRHCPPGARALILAAAGDPAAALSALDELDLTAVSRLPFELAATGMTNREVAQVTYMSAKTVKAHLASVYRKLGIRSRAQLGARVGALAPTGAPRT